MPNLQPEITTLYLFQWC